MICLFVILDTLGKARYFGVLRNFSLLNCILARLSAAKYSVIHKLFIFPSTYLSGETRLTELAVFMYGGKY